MIVPDLVQNFMVDFRSQSEAVTFGPSCFIRSFALHCENAWLHANLKKTERLTNLRWRMLLHSHNSLALCSLDLAPTDFHLFGSLRNDLNGQQFFRQ